MLTKNRPAMARQAVECFRSQTYGNKGLLILDTGRRQGAHEYMGRGGSRDNERMFWNPSAIETIGELRNIAAVAAGIGTTDILIHWDDDDWSHPDRIAEQVALLESSGADVVGYNEMLFWRGHSEPGNEINGTAEAWMYSNRNPTYALGTSLAYWRRTWAARPFKETSVGEDCDFLRGRKVTAVSSVLESDKLLLSMIDDAAKEHGIIHHDTGWWSPRPIMIARIHAGNTSNAYGAPRMRHAKEWERAPEWDSYCAKVFKGEK
jgi:glycosyltransferase involved in cell wall biosynthesis